jgi:hypothetical protein
MRVVNSRRRRGAPSGLFYGLVVAPFKASAVSFRRTSLPRGACTHAVRLSGTAPPRSASSPPPTRVAFPGRASSVMLAEASPTDPSRERGAGGDSAKRKHIVWNEDNLSYNEANKSVRARFARPDPAVRL